MWILPRAAILLLFFTAMLGVDRLAFRDISHFYTPLYDYVATRMQSDWLPLWNPLDHTGVPLIGETTTAVFYPLRWLLFALPLPSDVCLSFYVVVHLLIASAAARYAARGAGVSADAAAIAALVYPLSGSVLFLYTNPPFLVGAAWLPFVLSSLLSTASGLDRRRLMIASCASAMMILGGDPQTVLHCFITVVAVTIVRLIRNRQVGSFYEFRTTMIRIGLCAVVAAVLSLPQIAASFSWSWQSDRVLAKKTTDWLAPPPSASRRHEAFEFSVAPWHAVDFFTPNASGSLIPQNHRLSLMLPGEGKMWTPSIYMGMLVVLAMLTQVIRLRRERIDVWFGIAVATWFVANGHFGLVWYLQNLFAAMPNIDSAAGGLYWWLYSFFPGYDSLRYPAKWLPLTALALSIVTARFVDRWFDSTSERDRKASWRVFAVVTLVLVAALALTLFLRLVPNAWTSLLQHSSKFADRFWGPLDAAAGLRELQYSLLHSLLVLFAIALVYRAWTKLKVSTTIAVRCVLVVVTIDLFVFGAGIVFKVNRAEEQHVLAETRSEASALTLRTMSNAEFPALWQSTQSENRLLEVESSMRATSFGRWHLAERQPVFNSMVSIRSHSVAMFWDAVASELKGKTPEQHDEFWQAIRDWLAINRVIRLSDRAKFVSTSERDFVVADVFTTFSPQGPEAFYRLTKYEDTRTRESTIEDFENLLSSLRKEFLARSTTGSHKPERKPSMRGMLEVIESNADSAILLVKCAEDSSLQRTVYQDGHWHARLVSLLDGRTEDVTVESSEFLKQRLVIPAGHWQVTFWYMPWWLLPSMAVCLVGWIGIVSIQRVSGR